MMGRLRGILEIKKPPYLLIDVGGVGYELQVPMSTLYQLPEVGQKITLLTHLVVREDAHLLYGFYQEKERALFRALIRVSGVGPKMALTILSGMEVSYFLQCVERRETTALVQLPGVGKKTAERLIIEMAGKLIQSEDSDFSSKLFDQGIDDSSFQGQQAEAISALIALGYKPPEASRAVAKIEGENLNSQEMIRKALQLLSGGSRDRN